MSSCAGWIDCIQNTCKLSIQYPVSTLLSGIQSAAVDLGFASRLQAEAAQFQIQTTTAEAQGSRRFRHISAASIERRLNHVALDLLDRGREVGSAAVPWRAVDVQSGHLPRRHARVPD